MRVLDGLKAFKQLRILCAIICLTALTSCAKVDNDKVTGIDGSTKVTNKDNLAEVGVVGDNIPITRGEMARIVALSFYTDDEIDSLEQKYDFKDIEQSDYKKYINACVKLGYIQNNDKYRPDDYLRINEAQAIANNISKNSVTLKVNEDSQKGNISYALFVKTFTKVLENEDLLTKNNINYKNLIVLATKENNEKLGDNIITDYGIVKTNYIDLSKQLNSQVVALVRDNEIICITEVINNAPKLEDVYILKTEGNVLTIFVGGLTRQYISESNFDKDYRGFLCDVQIEGDKVLDFNIHENYVQEEIKLINIDNGDNKFIELENDKVLKFADYFQLKVFNDYNGKVRQGEFSDIVIGDSNTKFYINENNEIIGCVVSRKMQTDNIRVLINTSGFASKYHPEVNITSNKEFYVKNGEYEKVINANETYKVPSDSQNRITITPSQNAELVLNNVERHNGKASFEGALEIKKVSEGFLVTNVVDVETYLQRVVPSEMPSSYHKEALKAQAVTARSFAMKTLTQTSYKKYGANLDDSTSSQVYNNVSENEDVNKAIKETDGVVLTFEGKPISTNFYSTSSGFGASSGDVWADSKNRIFPTSSPLYLTSKALVSKKNTPTFRTEEDVVSFLKSKDIKAVDSKYPWFRWNYSMTTNELRATINKNIKDRYSVNPFMILTKVDGAYVEKPIESIGEIKDINVLARGDGGIITELEIVASDKTIKIMGEYNIRYILKPVQYAGGSPITITKLDGSTSANYSLIPSAFFVFDKVYDDNKKLSKISVFGGGNGHGVGMSQNGAEELAKNDIKYEDILKYFYTGTDLEKYK